MFPLTNYLTRISFSCEALDSFRSITSLSTSSSDRVRMHKKLSFFIGRVFSKCLNSVYYRVFILWKAVREFITFFAFIKLSYKKNTFFSFKNQVLWKPFLVGEGGIWKEFQPVLLMDEEKLSNQTSYEVPKVVKHNKFG